MKYWYQKQLRMVQTVLRESDAENYDAKGVVRYLRESEANCIIINAGGIIDFFHTGLEGENPTPFLTNGEMLGDLVREAHAADIKVLCRIDFRGALKDFYRAHPDWFARSESGGPKLMSDVIPSEEDLYLPCYNSRYMNEHAVDFLNALLTAYEVDGIWENAVSVVHGVCYCPRCRARYLRDTGLELPSSERLGDPQVYETYRRWKSQCAKDHIRLLRDTVKKYGGDRAYAAEVFGYFKNAPREQINVIDLQLGKENFDFFVTPAMVSQEAEPSRYPAGLAYPASIVKYMRMIDESRQAVLLFGNNGGTLRYVRDPMAENKIWLWESVSAGSGFWNCLFNGQHPAATHDNRAAWLSKPAYHFLKENEALLEDSFPLAEVAIYASKPTIDLFGRPTDPRQDRFLLQMKGAEKILTERHVQFVHLPDDGVTLEKLKRYRAVLLTNACCLSDAETELFKQYVAEGGSLISTFESSLYDENGTPRPDFALGEVFGVSSTGITVDTSADCYQLIRDPEHPLLKGIRDTEVLANCEKTLLVTALEGAQPATTYIPIIRNQPPERAWIQDMRTGYPVAVVNRYGKGLSVYFANELDRGLFTYAHDDFVELYGNALDLALGGQPLIQTNAPASVHVQAIYAGGGGEQVMLSLVNHTGTMYRPVQQVVPVHALEVRLTLPGRIFKGGRALYAEHPTEIRTDGASVCILLEKLEEFASFRLELEA